MKYFSDDVFDLLKSKTVVTSTGVTCGFCDKVFTPEAYKELTNSFPDVTNFKLVDKADSGGGHKRFYIGPEYVITRNFGSVFHLRGLSDAWRGVLNEVVSPEFMERLGDATGAPINTLCNFGFTYGESGCMQEPHLDGAIRNGKNSPLNADIAFLLYFNEEADPSSATEIYDLDRKTILLKGDTMRNSWIYFRQHPNAWHGFPVVTGGHTRRILSLTYTYLPKPLPIDWSYLGALRARVKKYIKK